MCNLYSITRVPEAVRRLFRVSHNRSANFAPQPAIFPGYNAPVICKAADGERELYTMSWGFVLLQPGKAPKRVSNVRDDKVLASSLAAVVRRAPLPGACLILLRTQRREAGDVALVRASW